MKSMTLMVLSAKSVYGRVPFKVKPPIKERIQEDIWLLYRGIGVTHFDAEEKRWMISPKAVRLIDSAYRDKDAGLARDTQLNSKKVWQDGKETVSGVMNADDSQLVAKLDT